ncbi:MAG: cysteine--tRNA ligase [Myxococcales bacterium]|nr:cysteine--tRNA ligase [Myxococcales bacterium]
MATPVRLYDSLRLQKVAFTPIEPDRVGMYLCGPTPYAPAHIGHAYSAICFDLIRRGFIFLGYQVRFVRNITDVEDKIFTASAAAGDDWLAWANRFADLYNADMRMFGVLPPDVEPRVSTHIDEIVAITARLVERGKAYVVDGDVYFEVATFPSYGRLSGQSLDDLQAGSRVAVDERKRSPFDFALWKAAKPGEPSWPSPWGAGRPGWHIECSAMSASHLGPTFDIHAGGKDLVFPHHENEIAQSQGAHGDDTFAHHWMHNGFLNFDGTKMSKSLGNVLGCTEIAAAVGPEALRFYFVSHHYRSPIDFEIEGKRDADNKIIEPRFPALEAADRRLDYFYNTLRRIDDFVAAGGDGGDGAVIPEAERLAAEAREALADDFNAPIVVAALGEAARVANRLLDVAKGVDKAVRRRSLARLGRDLRAVGWALGVLADDPVRYAHGRRARLVRARGLDAAAVEALLTARTEARAAKDFTRADAVRGELIALGVEILDTPAGSDWRVSESAIETGPTEGQSS